MMVAEGTCGPKLCTRTPQPACLQTISCWDRKLPQSIHLTEKIIVIGRAGYMQQDNCMCSACCRSNGRPGLLMPGHVLSYAFITITTIITLEKTKKIMSPLFIQACLLPDSCKCSPRRPLTENAGERLPGRPERCELA